jgi:hypothetical protein
MMACFRFLQQQQKSDWIIAISLKLILLRVSNSTKYIRLGWKYSVARELEKDNRISDTVVYHCCGPGRLVGIATGYELDGSGIESRWGARFSAPVRIGPGAPPSLLYNWCRVFPGVKSGQGVRLTFPPLLVPWSRKGRAIPPPPPPPIPMNPKACTDPQCLYEYNGAL